MRKLQHHIKSIFPIGYLNYYRYLKHIFSKRRFAGKDMQAVFAEIIHTNYWQGKESICGITSGVNETMEMRKAMMQWWKGLCISSVLDVPCGDFAWMKEMNFDGISYLGGDIVPEMIAQNKAKYGASNIQFEIIDITSSQLPKADLLICRDCLVHFSFQNIKKAIINIKSSGCRWLVCTSFVCNKFNYDIADGDWRTLNMEKPPFNFPKPEATFVEGCVLGKGVFADKTLCLWKVEDI